MSTGLPNAITMLRLAALPAFVWVVLEGAPLPAFLLLVGIAFSDWLDGWIARRYRLTSRLGAFLDPLADKLVQVTALALLAFAAPPPFTPVPAWLFGLVLARDLYLTYGALRIRRRRRELVIRSRPEGRVCTLLVFWVLFASLLGADRWIVLVLSILAAPAVVAAACRYIVEGRRQLREPG